VFRQDDQQVEQINLVFVRIRLLEGIAGLVIRHYVFKVTGCVLLASCKFVDGDV
jgi:hypothetical protein